MGCGEEILLTSAMILSTFVPNDFMTAEWNIRSKCTAQSTSKHLICYVAIRNKNILDYKKCLCFSNSKNKAIPILDLFRNTKEY